WASAGVTIPRDTYEQWAALPHISESDIQPGDLLYYNGIGHVAMYVGNGMIIDAPQPGQDVEEVSMNESWYADNFDGAAVPESRARWQKAPSYRAGNYGQLPGGRPP